MPCRCSLCTTATQHSAKLAIEHKKRAGDRQSMYELLSHNHLTRLRLHRLPAGRCMRLASLCHPTIYQASCSGLQPISPVASRPRLTASALRNLLQTALVEARFRSTRSIGLINALFVSSTSCLCATRPPLGYACRATKALVLECPCLHACSLPNNPCALVVGVTRLLTSRPRKY